MNKFEEYNASHITPQATLIKKFNELIKFLKQNSPCNVFVYSGNYVNNATIYDSTLIIKPNKEIENGDVIIFKNSYIGVIDYGNEETFKIYNAVLISGIKGESIESGEFTNGHFILTLTDGTEIDCGNMFNGNINLNGNLSVSGKIQSSEIIETMSGYNFIPSTREGYTLTPIYVSVVKNGNKLTYVQFMKIVRTAEHSGNDFISLGILSIPQQIGQKLTPYIISDQPALDNKQIPLFSAASSATNNKAVVINKTSNTTLISYMYGISSLNLNTEYIFRVESTFLLSENMVG